MNERNGLVLVFSVSAFVNHDSMSPSVYEYFFSFDCIFISSLESCMDCCSSREHPYWRPILVKIPFMETRKVHVLTVTVFFSYFCGHAMTYIVLLHNLVVPCALPEAEYLWFKWVCRISSKLNTNSYLQPEDI